MKFTSMHYYMMYFPPNETLYCMGYFLLLLLGNEAPGILWPP